MLVLTAQFNVPHVLLHQITALHAHQDTTFSYRIHHVFKHAQEVHSLQAVHVHFVNIPATPAHLKQYVFHA